MKNEHLLPSEDIAAPGASTVWKRFFAQATYAPHRGAIEWKEQAISYGQLASMAEEVTRSLSLVTASKAIIAVHGFASPGYIATLIAIMRAGAIILPIDNRLPPLRKRKILETCSAALVVNCTDYDADEFHGYPVVQIDPANGAICGQKLILEVAKGVALDYADPAYVFTTSGTTGQPKAVLGSAASLDHFVSWQRQRFELSPADRIVQITNLSFDPSLREMFVALTAGATLVIPDGPDRLAPDQTLEFMEDRGVTLLHVVPTLARFWLRSSAKRLNTLRATFFAGEPLTADLVTGWQKLAPFSSIINFYGPTETTLARFFWCVPASIFDDIDFAGALPVGQPIPDTAAVVVDASGKPLPPGESGEILIDTAFSSYGYAWDQSEHKKCFVTMPGIALQYGQRFYRTGDIGFVDAAGRLVVQGRIDNQIKIAGVRIEPREVEEVLRSHPGIEDAVVGIASADDSRTNKILAAWYIPKPGLPATPAQLRSFLDERLMRAMIPAVFFPVPELRRTLNGKIDMATLRQMAGNTGGEMTSCWSATEQLVRGIWSKVLNVDVVQPWDNFFVLGGDSLAALEVVLELERHLRVNVGANALFDHFTLRDFAAFLDQEGVRPSQRYSDIPSILGQASQSSQCVYPLSPQQRGYIAACMPEGNVNWCTLSRIIPLPGKIDEGQLLNAMGRLIQCHDVLRIRFPAPLQNALQEFSPIEMCRLDAIPFQYVEMDEEDYSAAQAKIMDIRAQGSQELFDLTSWPLFKISLIQLRSASVVIFWIHHLTVDGFSLNLLVEDIVAEINGTPLTYGETPGYRDYLSWSQQADADAVGQAKQYWKNLLDLHQQFFIAEATDANDARGRVYTQHLPADLVETVQKMAKLHGCTPFVIFLGAYIEALAQISGRRDILINIPTQNRPHSAFRHTAGLFFSQSIVRFDAFNLFADKNWPKVISRQMIEGQRHAVYEFHSRLQDFDISLRSFYYPLTTALFNQNRLGDTAASLASLAYGDHDLGRDLRFQIQGEIQVAGDSFAISYLYRRGAFPSLAAIEEFAECFLAAGRRVCHIV